MESILHTKNVVAVAVVAVAAARLLSLVWVVAIPIGIDIRTEMCVVAEEVRHRSRASISHHYI